MTETPTIKKLKAEFTQTKLKKDRETLANQIAYEYRETTENSKQALYWYKTQLNLSSSDLDRASAYRGLFETLGYPKNGRFGEAEEIFKLQEYQDKYVQFADLTGNKTIMQQMEKTIGGYYVFSGNYKKGQPHIEKSINLAKQIYRVVLD